MADPNLVTVCTFKGREYLIKMNIIINNSMNIFITDKYTGEEWQGNYEAAYIENLTHRTGNFKQFNIFTTMLKSGLLKTSDSVTLDLLTFEDLEILRSKRGKPFCPSNLSSTNFQPLHVDRRYLILTYSVEFDRIHYPLPLDYCGPPDPQILQANIRRLESEVCRLNEELANNNTCSNNTAVKLNQIIAELTEENNSLKEEINMLHCSKTPSNQIQFLHNAIKTLEESVLKERNSHNKLVKQLKDENEQLKQQLVVLTDKLQSYLKTVPSENRKNFTPSHPSKLCIPVDPSVELLFLNKNTTKSKFYNIDSGDAKHMERLTPLLPHISKIEKWEATLRRQNIETQNPIFHRNRSSSRERASKRNRQASFSDFLLQNQKPRRKSKRGCARSRSVSNSSQKSASSTGSNSQLGSQTKMRVKSLRQVQSASHSSIDFGSLQNRIRDLQNLLTNNLNL